MRRLCILSSALLLAGCQAMSTDSARHPYGHQETAGEQANSQLYPKSATYSSLRIQSKTTNSGRAYSTVSHSSTKRQPRQQAEAQQQNLWLELADSMQLDIPLDHPRVVAQRKWYLKHPAYMRSVSERARPFLYLIKEEIEKRNMPMELVLLPVVESTFDPRAYSHGHAAGLWQMLQGTGKQFGLHYDSWYDGRYDVMASTRAALDYLEYLNGFFDGDWVLALAAYNSGEGRVQRAMKANRRQGKPTDYWSLSLPKETQNYVPKLLALADILMHPDHYGMDVPPVPNRPQLAVVEVEGQVDLNMAADLAGMNRKQLKHLNPAFKRAATSPARNAEILVPVAHAQGFEIAMADLPEQERKAYQRYQVQGGDSLGRIARRNGTSIEAIRQANNLRGTTIRVGQTLMLPTAGRASAPSLSDGVYQVQAGDSLSTIASRFSVSITDLLRWNQLTDKNSLRAGQSLIVTANAG
ncbi:LysM peptidoglycan-binding domain-containing protein [Oceanisphaera psychrotolerans]|uniref:Lytic transglycosylase n=1 Tax=Oceanisphaera psychrotolerans TaxID=1414654 RepID=A0A1J4QC63_9GAMM|nr:LysM peptidoglycan-binding domain-containing protein [Oceanisphaera psychrotolerans]OIN07672.1 lytic transglycosylase [Oceanisphaera psychrotolerans]